MQKTLHRATFRRLICVAFAMIGFSVIAIGVTLLALRDDALRDATTDSGNIAGVLAAQTERSVQAAEIVLAELRERIDADRATSPGDFARVYSTPAVHELLKERRGRLPQSDFIFIADHKGKLVNTSRTWPIPELGLSDREFFRFLSHRDNGDQRRKLHISLPVMARVTGDSIIVFSSGLVDAKGEFLGVVGVALKTEYFHNIYNALTAIRGQSLALVRRDGAVLVRHLAAASDVGKTIAPYSPWYALAARGGGNFRTTDTAEPGDTHLVAVRPLRDYPLVVNVEVSQSAALKHWRGRAILIGVGTILAVLCSAFLLAALSKQFQRLLDSEASLAEREARLEDKTHELKGANERLDAAMNNMSHGLCMFDKDGRLLVCNERFMRTYSLPPEVVRPGARAR
ncbi:MAG: PAS-domain containing protein, partial [Proteobacteria bacterium]|nr:PAS-domain containing protein [Pseudomonadota bacterium]